MNKEKIVKQILLIAKQLKSGLIQPPPKMIEEITNWVNASVAYTTLRKYKWFIDDYEK